MIGIRLNARLNNKLSLRTTTYIPNNRNHPLLNVGTYLNVVQLNIILILLAFFNTQNVDACLKEFNKQLLIIIGIAYIHKMFLYF